MTTHINTIKPTQCTRALWFMCSSHQTRKISRAGITNQKNQQGCKTYRWGNWGSEIKAISQGHRTGKSKTQIQGPLSLNPSPVLFSLCLHLLKIIAIGARIKVWESTRTKEPGGLQSMGSQEWDTTEWLNYHHQNHHPAPGGSDGKESSCNAGDLGLIPGLGRSPGEGNCYSLQYSGLENSMDRGAWQATSWGRKESDKTEWLSPALPGLSRVRHCPLQRPPGHSPVSGCCHLRPWAWSHLLPGLYSSLLLTATLLHRLAGVRTHLRLLPGSS